MSTTPPTPGSDDERGDRSAIPRRIERRVFDDESPHLDRFGMLLVLTIATVGALSLVDLSDIENGRAQALTALALSLTSGVTLVLALRASGVSKRWRRGAEWLVTIAAALTMIGLLALLDSDSDPALLRSDRPSPIWVLIAAATPVAVVRRLLQHRRVTGQTIAGAIAAYLLIALAASYVFLTIDAYSAGGFFGPVDPPLNEFMYFSLVTITTLGYGDLVPDTPLAQLASTSVAVMGQVYLVTFVAMVVGLFIQQRDRT